MSNIYNSAIAYASKRTHVPFKEIFKHYGDSNDNLKGQGKLAQAVIYARERYRELKTRTAEAVEA